MNPKLEPKDFRLLRRLLADYGIETTTERIVEVMEAALKDRRECPRCQVSFFGLCFKCFIERVSE